MVAFMTTNPASIVDEAAFTVSRSIQIAAAPEKVWTAVTEPEHISAWFGATVLVGTGVGAVGTMTFPDYGSIPLRVEAFEPPHRVSYRWNNDDALGTLPVDFDESRSTIFTFTLEPIADGTRLTVVESGFENTSAPLSNLADHAKGWVSELDKLVALLETAS